MATHKVPQDVEAEDKLLGPLSLKQLIFTILGLGFGYLTYFFFAKVHPISSIIWIPPTLFFLTLGLYQRKDQPVEVYLAAAARYRLKPRVRIWNQEGYQERIIVTAPPKIDHQYTKGFTGEEAFSRLDSLSNMMDSRGWSEKLKDEWQNPRLATAAASSRLATPNMPMPITRSTQPIDVQDQRTSLVSRAIEQKIDQSATTSKQHALQSLQRARDELSDPTIQTTQNEPIPQSTAVEPEILEQTVPLTPVYDEPLITTLNEVEIDQTIAEPTTQVRPAEQISSLDDGSVEISLHH